jgi:orotidine-5'-phosphate decarboxylase
LAHLIPFSFIFTAMLRSELVNVIKERKSVLCVGLDSDIQKIPACLCNEDDPVFSFNKAIIDATKDYAVAYKMNTAFYESQGVKGWVSLEKTLRYIPDNIFKIADAKRGDIGNTAEHYARTFFDTFPFDSVTVAPYMGEDSIKPFLQYDGKWAIVLALTSNAGCDDFQLQICNGKPLYRGVMHIAAGWGHEENLMFVVGATRKEQMKEIREMYPNYFFLVPGVGAQGGDIDTVCNQLFTQEGGILINISRAIIFASRGEDFAQQAAECARKYQAQMEKYFVKK